MAPIRLASWAPRNTKPAWDWKARGSAELNNFDDAFGIKEYVQNAVGQILKDHRAREWSDWTREDYREKPVEDRSARKRTLMATYPGLLTGPHGVCLMHEACLPLYILSADLPIPAKSNVNVVIVLWTTDSDLNALTVFNNHLDENATFDSFTVDGESTSKTNQWAVGEKGKGFMLAIQYLVEEIDARIADMDPKDVPRYLSPGASFRVGEQIGEFKWKTRDRGGLGR